MTVASITTIVEKISYPQGTKQMATPVIKRTSLMALSVENFYSR